jgi:hypothetical protein
MHDAQNNSDAAKTLMAELHAKSLIGPERLGLRPSFSVKREIVGWAARG